MAYKNYLLPIALSSINSATFSGAYQLLSATAGLPKACVMLHIVNNSDVSITISYDGTVDHDFLLAASDRVLNFQENASPQGFAAAIKAGTKVYVKGSAGTGLVYLSGWYNPTDT